MKSKFMILVSALVFASLWVMPSPAAAYLGPGAGLSAIGSVLSLVVGIIVAVVGFLWYPFKRLMRKRAKPTKAAGIKN
jgi:cellobiose-specific phosphotransferase system component IIC